jgi:hypothetical protein
MTVSKSRRNFALLGAVFAIALLAAPAQAALEIRNLPTKNVSCSAGVCTATRPYAVMNAGDLASMLATSDVTLRSGSLAMDIDVKAPVSWASNNRLTLDSYRALIFWKPVTVTGSGALTLTTDDGGAYGSLLFVFDGSVTFWDLASSLIIDKQPYVLVSSISQLAQDVARGPNGNFALAGNYDARQDGVYAQAPVPTVYDGTFQGLGHTISNLTIDVTAPTYLGIGLFAGGGYGDLGDSTIEGLHVKNASVTANLPYIYPYTFAVGGLVGYGSKVVNDTVSGSIQTTAASGVSVSAGGIAGNVFLSFGTAKVSQVYAFATVSGTGGGGHFGGVAGSVTGVIVASHARAAVTGDKGDIGGLVGEVDGRSVVESSDAIGAVVGSGRADIGGLIGFADAFVSGRPSIADSHATGRVSGGADSQAGGLVGVSYSSISNSYATGNVSAGNECGPSNCPPRAGGLVGEALYGSIQGSFATGAVSAGSGARVGGLVGELDDALVDNSYSNGAVTAGASGEAGGLAGLRTAVDAHWQPITASYSTGHVSGDVAGGFLGDDPLPPGTLSFDYWDLDTSGIGDPSRGAGNIVNDPGITGLSDAQFKSGLPSGFDPAIWAENPSINSGLPYLLANAPP